MLKIRFIVHGNLMRRPLINQFSSLFLGLFILTTAQAKSNAQPTRQVQPVVETGQLSLALQLQPAKNSASSTDVVYVHGSTFGADLSIFYAMDGRSWADELNAADFNVWGFDFAGYGRSQRYDKASNQPVGTMTETVLQLHRIVTTIRQSNGNKPVALLAHSWGANVASSYASQYPDNVKALVLFAPVATRDAKPGAPAPSQAPAFFTVSALAQYRRFVEDVPRGQPQVLSESHFQIWAAQFLASDPESGTRTPAAVLTPFGPIADLTALWSGQTLYDASKIVAPTLLIRGAWDSLCTDADAQRTTAQLSQINKTDKKIERATHLMHLESQRTQLYSEVNQFLKRVTP
jgi:pimeloyl-ACP methyl ester carboxylesterase